MTILSHGIKGLKCFLHYSIDIYVYDTSIKAGKKRSTRAELIYCAENNLAIDPQKGCEARASKYYVPAASKVTV